MKVEQIYTGCIAEAAYYLVSQNEAAIVDPLREIKPYLERLERDNVKLKYIFETHFHADFVSGHVDLAKATGATIVYGPTTMKTGYEIHVGQDGEIFPLGDSEIKLIHTPGHTMESSCYLLSDKDGKSFGIITGDTLFIGDVGRPDLAQHVVEDLTEDKLAGHLFDSLRNKIMPLSDDLIVYPNHGAGSACGKNMSKETTDTLGNQKLVNYALNPNLNKEEFKKAILTGLTPPPAYFPKNVLMNIQGYESINNVINTGNRPLSPEAFEAAANETDALMLDTRNAQVFANGFIPNSINIGLGGQFAPWVGALIPDIKQNILLITEPGQEEESIIRLSRVGYDGTIGYLEGGMASWINAGKEIDTIESISPEILAERMKGDINVLDVRKNSEYEAEHVENVKNFELDYINNNMAELDKSKTYTLHCAGGYRSMIACSILKARGYDVVDVNGGFAAIQKSGLFEITKFVCPSTLK